MGKPTKSNQGKMDTPTPTLRISITNIQGPKDKLEKEWENPSEEDKEQSQKLWETDPSPEADPTATRQKVRFGLTRTVEYSQIAKETKKTEWKIFPVLFRTKVLADIYEAMNKYQEIGQKSRDSLLKTTNRQHQMAQKFGTDSRKLKPQYKATLRLKDGSWSNSNTLATVHALHKIILDLSGRSASNKITQHEGREYQIVAAIAQQWGKENMTKDKEGNIVRKVRNIRKEKHYLEIENEKEPNNIRKEQRAGAEQKNHQSLALKIMSMGILHAQSPSKMVGQNKTVVSGIISEAMNKIHQFIIKAPPMTPKPKIAQVNVGLVRDLETQLGRAVIYRDYQESNNLAQVGILISNCKRSLNNLYRNRANTCVEKEGKVIVKSILPNDLDDWKNVPIKKAIESLQGVDNFFKAVADSYQIPIMVAHGLSKLRLVREEQRPFLETTKVKIYGADYLTEKQTDYACLGFEESSQEVYQFMLVNKLYTRELIKKQPRSRH